MALSFLVRLQLESDADERAVRRAYARELKLIDQEHDPAGFQQLRTAYERALQWVQHRADAADDEEEADADDAMQAPAPGAAAPLEVASTANEERLGWQAAADFVAEFHRSLEHWAADNGDRWHERLVDTLASEALSGLVAREAFERGLAAILAQGWQKGHEVLFDACGRVFGWTDSRSFDHLQSSARVIAMAVYEAAVLEALPPPQVKALHQLLTMLRAAPADPEDGRELLQLESLLHLLTQEFSTLCWVTTDTQRLDHWRRKAAEVPDWLRNEQPGKAHKKKPASEESSTVVAILFIIWLGVHALFQSGTPPAPPVPSESLRRALTAEYHDVVVDAGASAPVASAGGTVTLLSVDADGRRRYRLQAPAASESPAVTLVRPDQPGVPDVFPFGLPGTSTQK